MKYLKLFQTDSEYQTFKNSTSYIKPDVSYIRENKTVKMESLEPQLIDNYVYYRSTYADNLSNYYFTLEYPAESNLSIQATYSRPNVVNGQFQGYIDVTDTYHIDKGNQVINETISEYREFINVRVTPEQDNVYRYIYITDN